MSLMDDLAKKEIWELFYSDKVKKNHMSKKELEDLALFIANEEYLPVVQKIQNHEPFPEPTIKKINKKNTQKKRTVFIFDREENYVLKLMSFLLYKYDGLFCPNVYSFRQHIGVKRAFFDIVNFKNVRNMYSYKADISDYFHSVDTEKMAELLRKYLSDDLPLQTFLISLIQNPYAYEEGNRIVCKKGIMAGVPVSGFLANLYLTEMDWYFWKSGVLYARYSDDIIVFSEQETELCRHRAYIHQFLQEKGLGINPKKENDTVPGETWEYLGFSYTNGKTDIAKAACEKLKAKMKRKARALYRWKTRKKASDERAIKAFIRHFNKKLYDNPIHNDITWCRWYFPVITTDETLKAIDHYMVECIRYIATGKYTKANYNLRYETICQFGFQSLVNTYYKERNIKNPV